MLIKPDDGGETYDRFRGRLMIPIRDARGRVIAFGGRILGRRRAQISQLARHAALRQGPHPLQPRPRRARQPGRQAADRRRRLYGRDRARPRRHRRGRRARTAPRSPRRSSSGCGGSTPRPILLLRRRQRPARKRRSAPRLRALPHVAPERTLRFVTLPAGQDPDDLVKPGGRAGVRGAARRRRAAGRAPVAARARRRAARPRPRSAPA